MLILLVGIILHYQFAWTGLRAFYLIHFCGLITFIKYDSIFPILLCVESQTVLLECLLFQFLSKL